MESNDSKIKEFLQYCPVSGEIIWIKSPSDKIKAGTLAGNISKRDRYIRKCLMFKKKNYKFHRVAWFLYYGEWPSDEIDFIDGDATNTKISNMRNVSKIENARNVSLPYTNTSGVIGVHWDISRNNYKAEITINRKNVYLGRFNDFEKACAARKQAELEYGFHRNHGKRNAQRGN